MDDQASHILRTLRMLGVMELLCVDCPTVAKRINLYSLVNKEKAWSSVDAMVTWMIISCKELLSLKDEEMKSFRRKWFQAYRRFEKIPNFH